MLAYIYQTAWSQIPEDKASLFLYVLRSMLSESKEIKYVSRLKIYTINVDGDCRNWEGRVILEMSVPKIINKDFTDAQDKQPFAVGGRANCFCCMNRVTFASKFCLICLDCRYNNLKSQSGYYPFCLVLLFLIDIIFLTAL
jgi:hypothetical protein